jgi:hypothetical protein
LPRTTQTPMATRPRTTAICATRRNGIEGETRVGSIEYGV